MEVNTYYIIGFIGFRGGHLLLHKTYKFWIVDKSSVPSYIVICGYIGLLLLHLYV